MKKTMEEILSELTDRVAVKFNLDMQDALAVVAQSKVADHLVRNGNREDMSVDKLAEILYKEIATAE